jgi:hypothetical protein
MNYRLPQNIRNVDLLALIWSSALVSLSGVALVAFGMIFLIVVIEKHQLECRTPWVRQVRVWWGNYEGCCCGTCIGDPAVEDQGKAPNVGEKDDFGKLFKDCNEDADKLKGEDSRVVL